MSNEFMEDVVGRIAKNYDAPEIFVTKPGHHFPDRDQIIRIIEEIRCLMFPRYFSSDVPADMDPEYFIGGELMKIRADLRDQVFESLAFRDCGPQTHKEIHQHADEVVDRFLAKLPDIQALLLKDVQAAFDGDPAAQSKEEIIFSYPGFFAIFVYRLAHEFYLEKVPLMHRIMTEYAHSATGVDLNAGATVGEYFFIDHATGVVIGETTIIGDHVKIYQGVTLGALSTRAGQALAGKKRHPTIQDNVTIYSNASVLGGETVVGEGTIIGGSAFVTSSIPAGSRVSVKNQEISVRGPKVCPGSFEI